MGNFVRPAEKGAFSGTQKPGWYNGDFNYDDLINADDYFLIDSAFIGQGGPLVAGIPGKPRAIEAAGVVAGQPTHDGQKDQASILSQLFSNQPVL